MTALPSNYGRLGAGRVRTPEETAAMRKRVIGFWHRCEAAHGTPVEMYASRRGLPWLVECGFIRYRPECWHAASARRWPAMIALIHDASGNAVALHKTYLTRAGEKAPLTPAKITVGSYSGGAIRIHPACAEICVGEGVESSASAAVFLDLPCWAAIACGNLGWRMALPPKVKSVVIACDNDPPGRSAARAAYARWVAEGRRVRIALPDDEGSDFNDVLQARLAPEVA